MENRTTMKISNEAHTFFFDAQSNIRSLQKEHNFKRKEIPMTVFLDFMVKYYKLNNEQYKELCFFVLRKYNGVK